MIRHTKPVFSQLAFYLSSQKEHRGKPFENEDMVTEESEAISQ